MTPTPFPLHARARAGFTLAEIILALMVMSMGLLAVIALTLAGTRDATAAIGLASAYGTARTALYDPIQVDPTKMISDSPITGFLNGYYVVRTIEHTRPVPGSSLAFDFVRVRIFWGEGGAEMPGISTYLQR